MVTETWGGEVCLGAAGGAPPAKKLRCPLECYPKWHIHRVPAQAGGNPPWPFLCLIFVPSLYHPQRFHSKT